MNFVDKFKERMKEIDKPLDKQPIDGVVETKQEPQKLFNIYKRTTNLTVNKCVGVGFTYAEAQIFREKRLKVKENFDNRTVTFYDIVPQGDEEAKNPLWNPKVFVKEA